MGGDEFLAFQMIDFVEKLPAEWEPKWKSMVMNSKKDLRLEGKQIDAQIKILLTLLKDNGAFEIEENFAKLTPDPILQSLLPVIQGLLRFLPPSRLTIEDALDMLDNIQES